VSRRTRRRRGGGGTSGGGDAALPVDTQRLQGQFPDLTDDDLQAYAEVTRRILDEPPATRGRLIRAFVARGREAEGKAGAGAPLDAEDALSVRYVKAIAKMQSAVRRPG
jgi:hypothetical protein